MVRETIVQAAARDAQAQDASSVFTLTEIADVIRVRLAELKYTDRQRAYRLYEDEQVSRRDFLKLVGVLGAGGIAAYAGFAGFERQLDAVTGRAPAGDSGSGSAEQITVPAGGKENIMVGDGETFENVLIDMTADGASCQINTSGSGWTIRNVGFKGNHPGGHYLITPGVADDGGEGLIENVYLGDGQSPRTKSGGVWVNANLPHQGTLIARGVHIAHMIDNGFYGSGPGAQGHCGVTHFEHSYFNSNNISNMRTNSKCETSHVENCHVKVADTRPCGVGCSKPGAISNRGVWSWYGTTIVRDSQIQGSLIGHKGGSVETENTATGNSATPDIEEAGAPKTAEEAACIS